MTPARGSGASGVATKRAATPPAVSKSKAVGKVAATGSTGRTAKSARGGRSAAATSVTAPRQVQSGGSVAARHTRPAANKSHTAAKTTKETVKSHVSPSAIRAAKAADKTKTPAKSTGAVKPAAPARSSTAAKGAAGAAKGAAGAAKGAPVSAKGAPVSAKAAGKPGGKTVAKTVAKTAGKAVAKTAGTRAGLGATAPIAKAPAPSRNGSSAAGTRPSLGRSAAKKPAGKRTDAGPYAQDQKFLDEQRELLLSERTVYESQATDLKAEADSLAQEREPGDVQFDEESGEGGTVTVDRERDLALSAQALAAVDEIDAALERIADRTYGACERCHQPIPKPRLKALPFARLCVACKSGGLSRR